MIFFKNDCFKVNSKEDAEMIIQRLNTEIEKNSSKILEIPKKEVKTTMRHNAVKVVCKTFQERYQYQDLINFRVKSLISQIRKYLAPTWQNIHNFQI